MDIKNKIKKVSDEQIKIVAGGSPGQEYIYDRLGIKHIHHAGSYDEYFIGEERIPWKYACALSNAWLGLDKYYLGPDLNATPESILNDFSDLKSKIQKGEGDDALNKLWQEFD